MTTLDQAYNEFIRDYCERHEACQATRDEAHKEADKMVTFGKSLGTSAKAFGMVWYDVDCMIEAVDWEHSDAAQIVALAASVTFNA